MMASKNGVGQIIKACVTGVTLIALPGGFRIIKAALDDLFGFTRWTCYAVWPAQLAYSLITLTIIDQILDVNLHRWTPVRVWDMGWYQCTPSSKSTTLESNMSLSEMLSGHERLPWASSSGGICLSQSEKKRLSK